jgi:hypothetical protein
MEGGKSHSNERGDVPSSCDSSDRDGAAVPGMAAQRRGGRTGRS